MPTQTLQRIALWGVRHYVRIFVCAAIVFAASMFASSRLRVDSDVLSLLPRDAEVIKTFRHTLEEFGGVDTLMVLVELPADVAVDPYETFVEELAVHDKRPVSSPTSRASTLSRIPCCASAISST